MNNQDHSSDDTEFVTADYLAKRWHTTRQGVLQQRHRGVLPPGFRIGKRVLWRMSDILEWETSRRHPTNTSPLNPRPDPQWVDPKWFEELESLRSVEMPGALAESGYDNGGDED